MVLVYCELSRLHPNHMLLEHDSRAAFTYKCHMKPSSKNATSSVDDVPRKSTTAFPASSDMIIKVVVWDVCESERIAENGLAA